MIKAFSNNNPLVLVLIPIFVALHLYFEFQFDAFNTSHSHITNVFDVFLTPENWWLNFFIVLFLVSLNASLINYIFNTNEFYERNTYLPALFYFLLLGFFPSSVHLNGELIAHTFIILALNELFRIRQAEGAKSIMFNTSFLLSVACIFNPIYIYFLPVIFFSLIIIRPFKVREFLMILIAPILVFIWVFVFDPNFYLKFFSYTASLEFERLSRTVVIFPNLIVLVLFLISFVKINQRLSSSSIRFRRLSRILFLIIFFAVAVSGFMFYKFDSYFYLSVGSIALPFILPYCVLHTKRFMVSSLLIYVLIIMHLLKFL